MIVIYLLLLVLACICFGLAAFAASRAPKVNLVALGLLFATLVPTIKAIANVVD